MQSIFRKAVAVFLTLACSDAAVLGVHNDKDTDLISTTFQSRTILKSDVSEYEKMVKVDKHDELRFYWNVNDKVLDGRMVYKGLAWLGFGISPDGKLRNAEAIIAKPNSKRHHKVCKYTFDGEKKWTKAEKMNSELQTLKGAKVVQNGKSTIMSFKKKLEENSEIAIKKDSGNRFFLVVGEKNTFRDPAQSYALNLDFSGEAFEVEHAAKEKVNAKAAEKEEKKMDKAAAEKDEKKMDEAAAEKEEKKMDKAAAEKEEKKMDKAAAEKEENKMDEAADEKEETKKDEAAVETKDAKTDAAKTEVEASTKKRNLDKKANLIFIIVGSCVGVLALLMLMLGTVAMRRQAEREMNEPLLENADGENDLA